MKTMFFFIVSAFISNQVLSQVQVVEDLHAEVRAFSGHFEKIIVAGGIDVYLTQSHSEGLVVSASEQKDRDAIKTEVKDNTLTVYFDGDKPRVFKSKNLRAYISFKKLEILDVSGASDLVVAGKIASSKLTLRFSGASDFKGLVEVDDLRLNLSGASDIKIAGEADELTIISSGASDVDGFGLLAGVCTAHASGASDINISVKQEFSAQASGSSEIIYRGDAAIKGLNKSGSSIIRKG